MTSNKAETPQSEDTTQSKESLTKNYGTAAAYAEEVRKWMVATSCWNLCHQMAVMHSYAYLMSCLNQQSGQLPNLTQAGQNQQSASMAQPNLISQRCAIPSFARRIVAELIDSIFAFSVKLLFVYCLVELGIINLEKYDKLLKDDADLQSLVDVTQELFPIEILGKVLISFIEALFITYGWGSVPAGSTPGKAIMAIQVISCQNVTPIPGTTEVTVVRERNICFKNSLLRSLLKNLLVSLLFPLSAVAYAFQYNRAVYDLAAKTIVVFA
ncbi:unnamed protein product [Enterobius vermicularis]|uniref:RDD domain-containing protein n=1 Tax=Enterobius vermicularis TaxID=51028 RepID=A0A0N4V736_ENTVE|nr:unnamed protein product [Enterobius vermicularis]